MDITGITSTIRLQIGPDSSVNSFIEVNTSFDIDGLSVDFSTTASSADSMEAIDSVLAQINQKVSYFGAILNRLDSVLDSQTTKIENYTQARSTIMDADIAEESAIFVKNQILSQTAAALLTQASKSHSSVITGLISRLSA